MPEESSQSIAQFAIEGMISQGPMVVPGFSLRHPYCFAGRFLQAGVAGS
jgi:hypothetical protein